MGLMFQIFSSSVLTLRDIYPNLPLTLSHVSRAWRDLVVNAPTLWTYIKVSQALHTNTIGLQKNTAYVEMVLARSGTCSLAVYLDFRTIHRHHNAPFYGPHFPAFCHRVRHLAFLVSQHAWRITHFTLVVDEFETTSAALGPFGSVSMPLLERWSVRNLNDFHVFEVRASFFPDGHEMDAHPVLLSPSRSTECVALYPNLRHVNLQSTALYWTDFSPCNLVTLNIGMLSHECRPALRHLLDILRASASTLKTLSLAGCLINDPGQFEEVLLPSLQYLDIGFTAAEEPLPFLQAVQFSALMIFELTDIRRKKMNPREQASAAFDTGISALLDLIKARVASETLGTMRLHHISLIPPQLLMPQPNLAEPLLTLEARDALECVRKYAARFFAHWSNLRYLALEGADRSTLESLDCVTPRTMEKHGTTEPRVPVPALTILELKNCAASIITPFVYRRLETRHQMIYKLSTLCLSMPKAWSPGIPWAQCGLAQRVLRTENQLLTPESQELLLQV
ncbi:hypothetical protein DXG03_006676 [Asterophora parasitica]|uniref:F-box domain-containing protein n=1 Tax=Asterophora parasitica TaxID=117018 RepID=A0A9P7G170_9AGAR|nr:hypothetical protein DXG03_006676 [Asterophora parasitica]